MIDIYEFQWHLYGPLSLLIIPALSCVPFLKRRRKPSLARLAPLVSATAFFAVSFLLYPYRLTGLIELITTSECDFTMMYWLIFFAPLQFVLSLAAAAGTYLFQAKRKRHNAN